MHFSTVQSRSVPRQKTRALWFQLPGCRACAFTLVEILIAIGILGLVLTAIYSSWTAILRASKVGLDAAAAAQRSRIAIRTIHDSLECALSFAQNQRYYGFSSDKGDDAMLSFVARLPKSFPRSGKFGDLDVRRVSFALESSPDSGRELVLRQSPILREFDEDEKEHPLVLAKFVKEFAVEFWDPRSGRWTDEWKQTNQLPRRVKISLQIADNDHSPVKDEIDDVIFIQANMVQPPWQTGGNIGQSTTPNPGGTNNGPPPPLRPGQLPEIKINPR